MNISAKIFSKFCASILFACLSKNLQNRSPLKAVCQISGDCTLSKYYIDNEWRLIVKQENDNLELLRDTQVPNGAVLYMICNANDIVEVNCENGQFNPPLSGQGCAAPMQPQLMLENNKNVCPYNLYRVGYEISIRGNKRFFDTYKVCFDFDRKRALFAINEAHPFVKSRPYGMQFDPDEIFTMNIFSSYNKREIYAAFNNILGHGQRFMPNDAGDERFDRGHLAPVGDYMTNALIATTFKMINVIPQFHTINNGNWRIMEEWARNPTNTPSKVCSGALGYPLQLPDTNGNLRDMCLKNSIPIPLWTYKIVLDRNGKRTVFLQYNNIHDKQMPPQIPHGICQQTACPPNIYLSQSNWLGYTYCCNPEHFLANVTPNLSTYC